jgi:hypothetical protein
MGNVGTLGEKTLELWCSQRQVDIIATPPDQDSRGWDFLLEFPLNNERTELKDLLPSPIMCKVQVKSSDQNKHSEGISISNLHTLVRDPLPVFFLFIEFDGQDNPEKTYLVHLDQEWAGKILKRVRELTLAGKGDHLNKSEMSIQYPESSRLENNSGLALKSCVEQHLSMGMEAYQQEKNKWIKSLGYEEGYYQVNIKYESHDPITDLVDLSIGIRDEITISSFSGYHKRFGLVAEKADDQGGNAILKMKVSSKNVRLTFRKDSHFSPGIEFQGEIYAPAKELMPKDIESAVRHFKLRMVFSDFDMVLANELNPGRISYSLSCDKKLSISDFRNRLSLLKLIFEEPRLYMIYLNR